MSGESGASAAATVTSRPAAVRFPEEREGQADPNLAERPRGSVYLGTGSVYPWDAGYGNLILKYPLRLTTRYLIR